MKTFSSVQVVSTDGMTDLEKINEYLKALILSLETTIPGSRGFGLSREFLDMPPNEAINELAIELEEKCEEYIPEITIANVVGDFSSVNGVLGGKTPLTIYVERRESVT